MPAVLRDLGLKKFNAKEASILGVATDIRGNKKRNGAKEAYQSKLHQFRDDSVRTGPGNVGTQFKIMPVSHRLN